MSENNDHIWGIILAGGEGKRLQPFILSRYGSSSPKQYCTFTGTRSMLRHTIDRAELLIQPEHLLTIVSEQHLQYAEEQLGDRSPGTVIVQPLKRETGPAILYPLLHVYQRDPDAIVCIFPSDHFVLNDQDFMKHLEFSSKFIMSNPRTMMLLGAIPRQSDGGYGWIVTGEQCNSNSKNQVFPVSSFVEKPDFHTAQHLYHEGGLWNTMVIVSTAKALLASFEMFTPILYREFWNIREIFGSSREQSIVEDVFSRISPVNFSYSILENKSVELFVLKAQGVYWSDWGDANRIQSDIHQYCAKKSNSIIPVPLVALEEET